MSASPEEELLARGREALSRGAWQEARAAFEAALDGAESPEALEGLGLAAWWLNDGRVVFDARRAAYRLYRERGDRRSAARIATGLAEDHVYFHGELAVASGWLNRAERLLEGAGMVPELGWLKVIAADLAMSANDPAAARAGAAEAEAIGRALGLVDLEMVAVALEGLALVSAGEVVEGMPRLDEAAAAALSGEMRDLLAVAYTCCYLVTACERARDFTRASQWCERVKEFAQHRDLPSLFAICRIQHASLLMWRGEWGEAEGELRTTVESVALTHPTLQPEGFVRLAELRRQQGRFEEVPPLLERAAGHPRALLETAALALEQDDPATTVRVAQRFLRQAPDAQRPERLAALDLLVRAELARRNPDAARNALGRIQTIVAATSSAPLRALGRTAEGLVAAAQDNHEEACRAFEDAADLYGQSAASFERARARMEFARSAAALGRWESAIAELGAAQADLERLGAAREARRARGLLQAIERSTRAAPVSRREMEVLKLVAQGLSNKQIARRLSVSEHTAKRHVANILTKLEVPSRAAAAAYAARRGLL
jgi:LuxR family transcriptional regulator, maltose regulon positive regulatory protein